MTHSTVSEAVINQLAEDIHATARSKGFWDAIDPFLAEINTKLLLITSEVSEAQKVLRDHYDDSAVHPVTGLTEYQGEQFIEELVDIIIRTLDTAQVFTEAHGSVGHSLLAKMTTNTNRPHKHQKRF